VNRYLAFVLIPAFFLSGCSRRDGSSKVDTGDIELTYWPAPNVQEFEVADSIVAQWNRIHPGIHVKMQAIPVSQSTEEVLLAAIAGGTTPDVCSNIWPGALHDYTQAGGLVPLDGYPDFDSVMQARTPRALVEATRSPDGHLYQVPWKTNPVMMFYNIDIFEKAGVDRPPRTYSEYLMAGEKISRAFNRSGQIDVWMGERDIRPIWWQRLFDFYPFYIAASGGLTLFSNGEPAFQNIYAQEVFKFFQACYAERYFPRTFFQGGDPFDIGKKATHFSGPWQVAHMEKFAPGIQYGIAPLPVPDDHVGPIYTYGDFKNISIFSNTKHPKEAWEFVKFLVTADHDRLLLKVASQIPIRGDLLTNPLFADYFRESPNMVKFAEQAPYTRGMDPVPDLKEVFDALAQAYEACAVYGKLTPAEAVQQAARRTRAIMEWNK
jgi:multiple sugar transport system substrate-binding protein